MSRLLIRVMAVTGAILVLLAVFVAAQPKPAKTVYFLVNSGACGCQQRACEEAGPLAAHIKNRLAAGIEFKKLDYAVEPENVEPLIKQYRLYVFPAFVVVDADGNELFKVQGRVDRNQVLSRLAELGVITGDGE